ncbi:MAG: zf-HC2 domain-containing protein, partial [Defluviitaleaceae bacterium]|nr:zf-HC2 domain-containing protein [Defluviitaleaceae bacterium]
MSVCDKLQLSLYADNMLGLADTQRMYEHLLTCVFCREYLNELESMKTKLENFCEIDVPDGFRGEVMARVRDESKASGVKSRRAGFMTKRLPVFKPPRRMAWGQFGTVAAGLLLTLVLFSGLGSFLTGVTAPAPAPTAGIFLEIDPDDLVSNLMDAADDSFGYAAAEAAPAAPAGGAPVAASPISATPAPVAAPDMMTGAVTDISEDRPVAERIIQSVSQEAQGTINFRQEREEHASAWSAGSAGSVQPTEQAIRYHDISIETDDFDMAIAAMAFMPGRNINSNIRGSDDWRSFNATRSVNAADYERLTS